MVLGLVGALSLLAQEVKPAKTGVINVRNDVKLEMVLIPAGEFMMGLKNNPKEEKTKTKSPQHEVTLTRPFYMGKYEVTQEQWESVMGNNPSSNKGVELPVTDVSWEDC